MTTSPIDVTGYLAASTPYYGHGPAAAASADTGNEAVGIPATGGLLNKAIAALAGLLILIFALHLISTREGAGYELSHIKIWSGYNWLAVTLSAMFGFLVFKLVFNLVHVPYVTDLVNFV